MRELFGYAIVPYVAEGGSALAEMRLTAGQEAARQQVDRCFQEGRSACMWTLGKSAKVKYYYLGAWVDCWPA